MSIGLKRGTVRLEKHQKQWEENAKKTIDDLSSILKGTDAKIRHVGSTAIRSIKAKPIIDIVIGVNDLEEVSDRNELLEKEGYILRQNDKPDELLYVKGDLDHDFITHHVHVVISDSKKWKDYLNLVEYLDFNRDVAQEYESLKERLAKIYADDRNSYTEGKSELIIRLVDEAEKYKNDQK